MTDVDAPRVREVEEIVLEMKDTSELMVDLAYSSVFYDSAGLAHEVQEMEEDMGEFLTRLQRLSLEAVRDGELDIEHAMILMRVAQVAEVIANSALEIADVILRDVELHPVLSEAIQESDSTIAKVILHEASAFCGHTLGDLELETETGMRVLAIKRAGRWDTRVGGETTLHAEDLLVAAGPWEAIEPFQDACAAGHEAD